MGLRPFFTRGMSSRSVIWGDRLVDHYRFGATLGEAPQLWRELNPGAFFNILDKDRLLSNALAFPVTRRCLVSFVIAELNPFQRLQNVLHLEEIFTNNWANGSVDC